MGMSLDFSFFLVLAFALTAPTALILAIIALNKINKLYDLVRDKDNSSYKPVDRKANKAPKTEKFTTSPIPAKKQNKPKKAASFSHTEAIREAKKKTDSDTHSSELEQRIGTRWVLTAGVITIILGVGFFLKYAYDNFIIGPLARVLITAVSGIITLCIGEITRKYRYEVVAKAVTALGFAILYASVFAAHHFYGLIGSGLAFSLAILITLSAMLYAVSLDEILMAIISLAGGFLTPIVVSTGENLPIPLFTYVLILGMGAMLCAYYRKWQFINLLAFVGTFTLYIGWFEKFFRSQIESPNGTPDQMGIALGWLGVFFAVYLVLPLFNGLVNKTKARREDVWIVLINTLVTFFYLWEILFEGYRLGLALCTVCIGAAHLVLMGITVKRCRDDRSLQLVLTAIGLLFLTVAVPLYFEMYAMTMIWVIESIVLALIGLRYRSSCTQVFSVLTIVLSLGQLVDRLPLHTGNFAFMLNPAFGTWVFVSAGFIVIHILYRMHSKQENDGYSVISQVYYTTGMLVLMAVVIMEWFFYCDYNISTKTLNNAYFINGMIPILTVFTLLLVIRPLRPVGYLCKVPATALGLAGSVYTLVWFTQTYNDSFTIFANLNFVIAILFPAGLFVSAWFLKQTEQKRSDNEVTGIFVLAGILVLWGLLSEQIYLYWYCENRYAGGIDNWRFLSDMFMSITWAIYGLVLIITGFWKKSARLRYVALFIFAVLLVKIFVKDMNTVKSTYRMAAFLATGVILVGISYLYQYLKNKGFFEIMQDKKTPEDN